VVTIGVTAILFGLTHVLHGGALGLERLLPSTLLGVVLGVVCWVSGSVMPGTVLHICHNTALELLAQSGEASRDDIPTRWLIAGLAGTAVGLALLLTAGRKPEAAMPVST